MTELIPINVREKLDKVRENISDTFDHYLSKWRRGPTGGGLAAWTPTWTAYGGPPIDVEEDASEIRVLAELPGLNKNDFKVQLEGNRLVIRGEKQQRREEKKRDYDYSECRYGAFARSVDLPCEVEQDRIEATYKNGVLNIRLPKIASAQAHKVKVNIAEE